MHAIDWLIIASLLTFIFYGNRRASREKKSVAVRCCLRSFSNGVPRLPNDTARMPPACRLLPDTAPTL